jgi:exonuclease SbcD
MTRLGNCPSAFERPVTASVTKEATMIRIAHFSDLHYSSKNLEEADRCFGYAVGEAIQRGMQVAVISGDSTDHALDMHNPAVERLARQVLRLANHCPVLMLQGTFSHEPPGTLSIFRLLGGRHPVHVADRIAQVALRAGGAWVQSNGWRFEQPPTESQALFTCVPTTNKATVAASVGAAEAGIEQGHELAALLAGYASIHHAARQAGVPTIGVSHGTVTGCITEHGVPMAGFDHEFTTGALFASMAQAFLLGHIHRHQTWAQDGRIVGYAGSIGRFHHGEVGDKGFV